MPIDIKNKIVHIHIPKCAGTSVANVLKIYGDWKKPNLDILYGIHNNIVLQSLPLEYYSQYYSIELLKQCTIFAVVRNPYDRVLSDYCWRNRKCASMYDFLILIKNTLANNKKDTLITYNSTILFNHFLPQHKYIECDNIFDVKIIRFENIKHDMKDKLNINMNCHTNTTKHMSWQKYFSDKPKCIQLINEIYKKDFEMFNYDLLI